MEADTIEVFHTSRGIKITESILTAPKRHLGDVIEYEGRKYVIKYISYKNEKWLLDVDEI